jgi:hypothetical protein
MSVQFLEFHGRRPAGACGQCWPGPPAPACQGRAQGRPGPAFPARSVVSTAATPRPRGGERDYWAVEPGGSGADAGGGLCRVAGMEV